MKAPLVEARVDNVELHQHAKRHFYVCGGQTLSWQSTWYFQPWFTSDRASYDSAASLGPVSPPITVISTVPACSAALAEASLISSVDAAATTTTSGKGAAFTTTITTGRMSAGIAISTTFTSIITSLASSSTQPPSSSQSTVSSISSSSIIPSVSSGSSFSSSLSSSSPAESSPSTASILSQITDVASINTCAGGWDWQGWGTLASLGVGAIFGGILWISWLVMRGRVPGFFSPRSWFVPPE